MSPDMKLMRQEIIGLGLAAWLVVAWLPNCRASTVTLGWSRPQTTDSLKGYWLYCGRQPTPTNSFNFGSASEVQYYPGMSTNHVANADLFTYVPVQNGTANPSAQLVFDPNEGGVWFFTIQSMSAAGLLSTNSNEIAFMVPPGEPQGPPGSHDPLLTTRNLNLREFPVLVAKLLSADNPVTEYIRQQLTHPSDPAKLIDDLNTHVIDGPSIFSAVGFVTGIDLRPGMWDLMTFVAEENPPDANDVQHLNRLLLEDAFPLELWNPYAPAAFASQSHVISAKPGLAVTNLTNGNQTILDDAWSYTWNRTNDSPSFPFLYKSRNPLDTNQTLYAVLVARWSDEGHPVLPAGTNLVLNIDGTFRYTHSGSDAQPAGFDYVIKGATGFSQTNTIIVRTKSASGLNDYDTGPSQSGLATPAVRMRPSESSIGPGTVGSVSALAGDSPASLACTKLTPHIETNGHLAIQVDGVAGLGYRLQTSTNLIEWTDFFSTNAPSSSFIWVDPDPPEHQKFYRLQQF